jgi:hypothetical protein
MEFRISGRDSAEWWFSNASTNLALDILIFNECAGNDNGRVKTIYFNQSVSSSSRALEQNMTFRETSVFFLRSISAEERKQTTSGPTVPAPSESHRYNKTPP